MGLIRRSEELNVPAPESVTADNCCSVRAAVHNVAPDMEINLDVHHFKKRYVMSSVSN